MTMDGNWRMASGSNTAQQANLGASAPVVSNEVVLAVLDDRDFARARIFIDGFDRWDSFDDFVCERDGLHIGLSTAGQEVRLALVSVRDFEQWTLHSGMTPSLQALDEFAACTLESHPDADPPVESLPPWENEGQELGPLESRAET
jgi:hypothetical protein